MHDGKCCTCKAFVYLPWGPKASQTHPHTGGGSWNQRTEAQEEETSWHHSDLYHQTCTFLTTVRVRGPQQHQDPHHPSQDRAAWDFSKPLHACFHGELWGWLWTWTVRKLQSVFLTKARLPHRREMTGLVSEQTVNIFYALNAAAGERPCCWLAAALCAAGLLWNMKEDFHAKWSASPICLVTSICAHVWTRRSSALTFNELLQLQTAAFWRRNTSFYLHKHHRVCLGLVQPFFRVQTQ